MSLKPKQRATLEEILASTSDVLFPAEMGQAVISVSSQDCCGDTPLHVMVRRNDAYAVRKLIEAGANVNAIGDMSETPLHVALSQENLETIEALLKAGANTLLNSEFNRTALETAKEKGGEIAKLFKLYGHT